MFLGCESKRTTSVSSNARTTNPGVQATIIPNRNQW